MNRWTWLWKGAILVVSGIAGGLGLVAGYLIYSGTVVLVRMGFLSCDIVRYLVRILTFGLLALVVTCQTWEYAGPGRDPIDVYTYYQVDDSGVTFKGGNLYFYTMGSWYITRGFADGTCVVEEGTVPPPGQDERPEEDR